MGSTTEGATLRLMPIVPTGVSVPTRRQAGPVPRLILRLERLQPEPAQALADGARANHRMGSVVDLAGHLPNTETTLGRWSATAAAAQDGCLVLDPQGHVVSLSATAAELLDCSDAGVIGRRLADVTELVDFDLGEPDPSYADRVPPLAALRSDSIVRSLMRVRHRDDSRVTLDVCGMPLHDAGGRVVGSLSFLNLLGT